MEHKDGSVEIVEVKGRMIKIMQRDYPLRRHIFILKYRLMRYSTRMNNPKLNCIDIRIV
ncbi:hypothetical protein [Paenibacillus polymyxa]|uniref:hypothetical protein n=1 Tax=Paenibacillus polymyxa TaxID=1406 RepID=UPI003B67B1C8